MRSTFKAALLLLALSTVVSLAGLGCNNDAADTKPVPKPDNPKALAPMYVLTNQQFVQNGRITPDGMTELKKRMPHMDFSQLEKDPDINKMQFTVDTIVNYIETKVNAPA